MGDALSVVANGRRSSEGSPKAAVVLFAACMYHSPDLIIHRESALRGWFLICPQTT